MRHLEPIVCIVGLVIGGVLGFHAALGYFETTMVEKEKVVTKLPTKPDVRVNLTRLQQWPIPKESLKKVSQDTFDLDYVKTTYYEYQDGILGYKLHYILKTTDPAKPLAWSEDIEREGEEGVINSEKIMAFNAIYSTTDPKWSVVNIEGTYWKSWKPDGDVQCVGGCKHGRVHVSCWDSESTGIYKDAITISSRSKDGYYWGDHPMDSIPVHQIELIFYMYPTEKLSAIR